MEDEKLFNHKATGIVDKIALLGEIQHAEAHAIRSAISLYDPEKEDDSDWGKYAIWAKALKDLRREYQRKAFPGLSEYDWCLLKSLSRVRQLAYETQGSDYKLAKEIDDLIDDITGEIFGEDLSQCAACKEDKADQ